MHNKIIQINKKIQEFNQKWENQFSFFQPVTIIENYNIKDEFFLMMLIEVKNKIIKDTDILFSELLEDYDFLHSNNDVIKEKKECFINH